MRELSLDRRLPDAGDAATTPAKAGAQLGRAL
jgi:hypothetical protein